MEIIRKLQRFIEIMKSLRFMVQSLIHSKTKGVFFRSLKDLEEELEFFRESQKPHTNVKISSSDLLDNTFPSGLLVSTSSGLYLLTSGYWIRLIKTPGFGVAVSRAGDIYAVCSPANQSHIIKGRLNIAGKDSHISSLEVLCSFRTSHHPERIHQISWDYDSDCLLCANTRRNSILTIDSSNGQILEELFPFVDRFDKTIITDHNHINAVSCHKEKKLFTVHTLGPKSSGLGFIDGDRVRVYSFEGRGCHDILLHDGGVVFTDSFNSAKHAASMASRGEPLTPGSDFSGSILAKGSRIFEKEIASLGHQVMTRGIAYRRNDMFVGVSAYSRREKRFARDGGGVLVFRNQQLLKHIDGPFSQVYDILPADGLRTDKPVSNLSSESLHEIFCRDVGPCVYDETIKQDIFIPKLG